MTQKQSNELDKLLESIKELRNSQAQTDEQMKKTDEKIARLTEHISGVNKSIEFFVIVQQGDHVAVMSPM